jgi:hypothetical protein
MRQRSSIVIPNEKTPLFGEDPMLFFLKYAENYSGDK